jgi:hypothetical protein
MLRRNGEYLGGNVSNKLALSRRDSNFALCLDQKMESMHGS